MKKSSLFRFFIIGLIISSGVGLASFYALRALNESSTSEIRKHMILFITQIIENAPYTESIQDHHFHPGKRFSGSDLWIISDKGDILATNTSTPLPISWDSTKKPTGIHDFTFHYRPFRLAPDLTLVKLDAKEDTYLLIGSRKHSSLRGPLWVQATFIIFVVGIAVLIAMLLITVYLKEKSREARLILSRLEKGDLKARFEIKRLDEIGSLMLDFNRMASEIERLIYQIHQTENTRKNLLEELSHDLRTPLTSLKTAIETLTEHLDEMPKEQQREFLSLSYSELTYFLHLIEDLFFIADLGEPRYKKTTEEIDLRTLISEEIKWRRSQNQKSLSEKNNPILWKFEESHLTDKAVILGDPILIQRLIKNSLDNAYKFAKSVVKIQILSLDNDVTLDKDVTLIIENDGVGISDDAIAAFGQRKKQRIQIKENEPISLGLGSVIIKAIIELHGGSLQMERIKSPPLQGSRLLLKLPKSFHKITL